MNYDRLGLTPQEEALLVRMWNHGMQGRGVTVGWIISVNVALTALLTYAVAAESWLAGGLALGWIAYNTVTASIYAARDVPLWRSAMTKVELALEKTPDGVVPGPAHDAAEPAALADET